jgi:ATP-dependent DNA helicase RecG
MRETRRKGFNNAELDIPVATMVQTNDGFKIEEVDLQLRGPGDFFGTRQSGVLEFKVADILADKKLLDEARGDAFALIERDARLQLPEHSDHR